MRITNTAQDLKGTGVIARRVKTKKQAIRYAMLQGLNHTIALLQQHRQQEVHPSVDKVILYTNSQSLTELLNVHLLQHPGVIIKGKSIAKAKAEFQRAFWRGVVSEMHRIKTNCGVKVIAQKYKRLDR